MLTAILVDGPFFIRRIRQIFPSSVHHDAKVMADLVWRLSAAHLFERNQPKRHLFRIFFYDTPVFAARNPAGVQATNRFVQIKRGAISGRVSAAIAKKAEIGSQTR